MWCGRTGGRACLSVLSWWALCLHCWESTVGNSSCRCFLEWACSRRHVPSSYVHPFFLARLILSAGSWSDHFHVEFVRHHSHSIRVRYTPRAPDIVCLLVLRYRYTSLLLIIAKLVLLSYAVCCAGVAGGLTGRQIIARGRKSSFTILALVGILSLDIILLIVYLSTHSNPDYEFHSFCN
jgi:hypothetical protein